MTRNDTNRKIGIVGFDPAKGFSRDDARALISGTKDRQQSVLILHRLMEDTGGRPLVTYRCRAHKCQLLDVFSTPEGIAVWFPPAKFSPEYTEDHTDAVARAQKTTDEDGRRWAERGDLVLNSPDDMEYWVSCDHLLNAVVRVDRVRADAARRAGVVLI